MFWNSMNITFFCFSFEIELLGVTLITMNFFSDKTFASTAENGEGFHIILKWCCHTYGLILQYRMKSWLKNDKHHQVTSGIWLHHIECFILKTQDDLSNELFSRWTYHCHSQILIRGINAMTAYVQAWGKVSKGVCPSSEIRQAMASRCSL